MAEPPSFRYDLTVTGPPRLCGPDGRAIQSITAQPKRLGLLTYLVLSAGAVPRSRLMALFWPESAEGKARNALNQSVFYLRRSLDATAVESAEPDSIRVPTDLFRCDARLILDEEGIGSTDIAALYKGPLLDGWGGSESNALNDWLDKTRARLDRIVVRRSLEAAHERAQSDPNKAADWALRAADLRPWDPGTRLEAVSVLMEVGRARAARDLTAALERDLPAVTGGTLSAEWRERFQRVLEGAPLRPQPEIRGDVTEERYVTRPSKRSEQASPDAGVPAPITSSQAGSDPRSTVPVWRIAGAFVVAVALVGLSGSALKGGGGDSTELPSPAVPTLTSAAVADQRLVVLIPRVDAGMGAPSLDSDNLFTAIKALLPPSSDNTIAALGVANSLTGLRGQLETVGIPGRGTLVIETVVRVTGEQAVLNAFVHRYHTSALLDRVTAPFKIDEETDLLLEFPDALARVVVELAERWIPEVPGR